MRAPVTLRMLLAGVAISIVAVAGCEPTGPPAFAVRSTAPATQRPSATAPGSGAVSPGTSSAATEAPTASNAVHPTGSPSVDIAGDTITVLGTGDKNTQIIDLDGNYRFTSSACPGTGVIPFVWVYEEFGQSRGTYVDAEFTVKNLKGRFYLRISGPPTCNWTVTLTKV